MEYGVKEIMHVPFRDERTARLMVRNEVFYNPQMSQATPEVLEAIFGPGDSVNKSKAAVAQQGMARIAGILLDEPDLLGRTVFGVDVVTTTPANAIRTRDHEVWYWADRFGNLQALKSMTSIGGQLAALTGKNNPYLNKLGVIEVGAYADILLVDGNPLEDISVIGGSEELFDAPDRRAGDIPTMRLIMKEGKIYKNTL